MPLCPFPSVVSLVALGPFVFPESSPDVQCTVAAPDRLVRDGSLGSALLDLDRPRSLRVGVGPTHSVYLYGTTSTPDPEGSPRYLVCGRTVSERKGRVVTSTTEGPAHTLPGRAGTRDTFQQGSHAGGPCDTPCLSCQHFLTAPPPSRTSDVSPSRSGSVGHGRDAPGTPFSWTEGGRRASTEEVVRVPSGSGTPIGSGPSSPPVSG